MNEKATQFSFLNLAHKIIKPKTISVEKYLSRGPLPKNPIFHSDGGEIITVERGPEKGTLKLLVEDLFDPVKTSDVILTVEEFRSLVSSKTQKKLRRSKP